QNAHFLKLRREHVFGHIVGPATIARPAASVRNELVALVVNGDDYSLAHDRLFAHAVAEAEGLDRLGRETSLSQVRVRRINLELEAERTVGNSQFAIMAPLCGR